MKPWKNAAKLKNVKLGNGDIFLLYEIWSVDSYQYTAYMIVDSYGEVEVSETKICYPIRLHKTDAIYTTDDGDTVLIYEGLAGGYINIYRVEPSYDPNAREDNSTTLMANMLTLALVACI